MELDLSMYKEGYKNIAIQVKELEIVDNEAEIERLEKVIAENQAKIEAWKKPSGMKDAPEQIQKREYNKDFENYAEPYNAKIREAQKQIIELQNGIEENKKQKEENKKSQEELKAYMDTARKNAEIAYKEARQQLEDEWENGDSKKQYDSKMETMLSIQSKENKTSEERAVLLRFSKEIRELKQGHLSKLKKLDEDYKQFLQDLDDIDNEYGINELEQKPEPAVEPKVESKSEVKAVEEPVVDPVEKSEAKPVEEPVVDPVEKSEDKLVEEPVVDPVEKSEAKPVEEPVVDPVEKSEDKLVEEPVVDPVVNPVTKTEVVLEPKTKPNEKFSYEFSVSEIKYDGKKIDPAKLLEVYENHRIKIEEVIVKALGDKENVEDFMDYADKFIYSTIILSHAKPDETNNKIKIDRIVKDRLREYYDVWNNPRSEKESNMSITYDFKGTSLISKFFKVRDYDFEEEIENLKDIAFEQRKRKNVTIKNKGLGQTIRYMMSDAAEKFKNFLFLDSGYEYGDEYEDEYEYEYEVVDSKDSSKSFRQKLKEQADKAKEKFSKKQEPTTSRVEKKKEESPER